MSSRALRRAQRELEEKQIQEKLARDEKDAQESDSEPEVAPKTNAKPSLFAMLGDGGDEDDEDDEDATQNAEAEADNSDDHTEAMPTPAPNPSKKNKKKKKKAKGKSKAADPDKSDTPKKTSSGLDEIDQALLALKMSSKSQTTESDEQDAAVSEEKKQLFSVLSVDTQHLHAVNEMKKLFGRAALQQTEEEARPRQRGQQGNIAAALAGRNAGNRNLASIGLRRNIFIQGKEEWPRATSGGLAMEVVEKRADGSVEYRFVHNTTYQDVQRQFQVCVASMDPDRMVQLLANNPYHISTLLQVSEIAKQQRENAAASEMLERALFTFGRSVHSTFSANLAAGKARLDFRRPENREFWLAVWRYIATLGIRATWRTAFEWAKLLIAMDPEQDPYCLRLLIDQLALRGRDPQALVDLVDTDYLQRQWKVPPNLAFSVALAHDRIKEPQKARSALRNAIKEYPWIAARLCKELDISPIPKPVWGKEPNGDYQELLCQLYVPKAKDLWNTTEGTTLLVEMCYSFEEELGAGENPYWLAPVPELDLARHVILSDNQALISLLEVRVKEKFTSVSDPLAPEDSTSSYETSLAGSQSRQHGNAHVRQQLLNTLANLRQYFEQVGIENMARAGDGDLEEMLQEAGSSVAEFQLNTERFQVVRMHLEQEGIQVVFDEQAGFQDDVSDSETGA